MPLTLYYLPGSPPARSVDLLMHTLDLEAEKKIVNLMKKEQYAEDYLKLNPLHTVPAIIDEDGFILWESRAIMTYLVSKYGKDDSLYPKDFKKRAIVDQRLHYSNDVFYCFRDATKNVVFLNKKATEDQIQKIKEAQENVEKLLKGHKFMAGDSLTVADFSFITIVDALKVYSPTDGKFPLTKAWLERCKTLMKDFEEVNTPGAQQLLNAIKERL